MAKSVPNPERFRKKTEELQTRERPEIIKDLEGLPLSVAKLLVGKLKRSGRLQEQKTLIGLQRKMELERESDIDDEQISRAAGFPSHDIQMSYYINKLAKQNGNSKGLNP